MASISLSTEQVLQFAQALSIVVSSDIMKREVAQFAWKKVLRENGYLPPKEAKTGEKEE